MDNSSLGIALGIDDQSSPTYIEAESSNRLPRARQTPPRSTLANIGGMIFLGFTVISSPIAIVDPRRELRISGSASTMNVQRQRRRRITLAHAWAKAGQVYANAQRRRLQQREREAREFLWSFTEDTE